MHVDQHTQRVLRRREGAHHYDRKLCQLALIHHTNISYTRRDCLSAGWNVKQDSHFVIEGVPENNNIFLKGNPVTVVFLSLSAELRDQLA